MGVMLRITVSMVKYEYTCKLHQMSSLLSTRKPSSPPVSFFEKNPPLFRTPLPFFFFSYSFFFPSLASHYLPCCSPISASMGSSTTSMVAPASAVSTCPMQLLPGRKWVPLLTSKKISRWSLKPTGKTLGLLRGLHLYSSI